MLFINLKTIIMENTCNYSDEWQPYIGDYDKFEYDVKLKDGTVVENCYPNGGKFNSISDKHDGECFDESDVAEIRFSENPRFGINEDVSKYPQYDWIDSQNKKKIGVIGATNTLAGSIMASLPLEDIIEQQNTYVLSNVNAPTYYEPFSYQKPPQYIREIPKVYNNSPCTCGSGKKFKKCCKA